MTEFLKLVHFYSCIPVLCRVGRVTAPVASGWTWAVFSPLSMEQIGHHCPGAQLNCALTSGFKVACTLEKASTSCPKAQESYNYQTLITLTPVFLKTAHMKNCTDEML